ncbi:hypothetical protein MKK53_15475 [Methylobacterium sp. J-076]|jgi:hypothetical protein|nr:hypothetical protein [Methylobacterium sp. J-076]MCJ2013916.1 hypothetical protein [Methylobacterium sp. J-076]
MPNAVPRDAELFADRAGGLVSGDQVARADCLRLTGRPITHLGVLAEVQQIDIQPKVGAPRAASRRIGSNLSCGIAVPVTGER